VIVGVITTSIVLLPPREAEANSASDWTCKNVPFAKYVCGAVEGVSSGIDFMKDPLGYIAEGFARAVTWFLGLMFQALQKSSDVDLTNAGFLKTYALAFGVASVLVVILWIIAVVKRALAGVDPMVAMSESFGFLLMAVVVTAFAPAITYYVVALTDKAAMAMLGPALEDTGKMATTIGAAFSIVLAIPGGAIVLIFLGIAMLVAIFGLWLMLIIRSALIFAGLVFGPLVFAGLVDRDLWGHSKKWLGQMVGVIVSKYVIFTIIALSLELLSHPPGADKPLEAIGTIFTALALLYMAVFMPFQVAKFVPTVGDEIQAIHQAKGELQTKLIGDGPPKPQGELGDLWGKIKGARSKMAAEGADGGDVADTDGATQGDEASHASSATEASTSAGGGAATGGVAAGVGAAKAAVDKGKEMADDAVSNASSTADTAPPTGGDGASAPPTQGASPSSGDKPAGTNGAGPDGHAPSPQGGGGSPATAGATASPGGDGGGGAQGGVSSNGSGGGLSNGSGNRWVTNSGQSSGPPTLPPASENGRAAQSSPPSGGDESTPDEPPTPII
jgi:hypothetical protein